MRSIVKIDSSGTFQECSELTRVLLSPYTMEKIIGVEKRRRVELDIYEACLFQPTFGFAYGMISPF